jgi:hypothetical protein
MKKTVLEWDAIEMCVRGFHDEATGEAIIAALEEMGFVVKEAIDGASDDHGGIIETHITDRVYLDAADLDEIRKVVYAACPESEQVYVEHKLYYNLDPSFVQAWNLAQDDD